MTTRFPPGKWRLGFLAITCVIAIACAPPAQHDWTLDGFKRFDGNPILRKTDREWESKDVFNPAAWTDGKTIYLLYRAEDQTGPEQWHGTSRIGLATSTDGYHFDRRPKPVLEPTEPWETPGGCEDPRLVRVDDTYVMTYTGFDAHRARLAIATSPDLVHWKKHGVVFPDLNWSKSGAILAKKTKGKYWMYFGESNIWAATSTDLVHWDMIREPVLKPRDGRFDSHLVEPGPPPLLTEHGILLLYNGVDEKRTYRLGQVLFDADDPTKVIARTDEPLMEPETRLERGGQVPNVVFCEGLVHFRKKWLLYFGMGDSGIGVATSGDTLTLR